MCFISITSQDLRAPIDQPRTIRDYWTHAYSGPRRSRFRTYADHNLTCPGTLIGMPGMIVWRACWPLPAPTAAMKVLAKLSRLDLLVVDDFCMAPMTDGERRDFLEICDTRY